MENKLYLDTNDFLGSMESDNTRKTYLRAIEDFIDYMFKKGIKELSKEDFEKRDINYQAMIQYKIFLTDERQVSNQTVRTKLYSVASWMAYLYKIGYKISNPEQLKLERKSMPKVSDNNGSKPFTHGEVLMMIDKAKEYPNGLRKSVLIELAYITSWRKEALLNVKVKDLYKNKDKCNYYLIDCLDKGSKEDTKPISIELYERIFQIILDNNLKSNDNIFDFTAMTCDRMINELKEDLHIVGDKTFHSLRKASINRVLDLTDNLIIAKNHANHDNISTTEKFYVKHNLDYSTNVSLSLMEDIDDTKFDNLTKEDLISLIKDSEDKIKFALLTQLKNKK